MINYKSLDSTSPSIQHLCKVDKYFLKVYSMVGDIKYQVYDDGYSFLVGRIIEQMLSKSVASMIYSRLETRCSGIITPFSINLLSDDEIKSTGTSRNKVIAIRHLTEAIISEHINLPELNTMTDAEIINKLTAIHGIGNWTAKMYLIFVLDRQDVLPFEDAAFLQVYKWVYKDANCSPKAIKAKCEIWRPYSSIASRYFYRALDGGLTKQAIN